MSIFDINLGADISRPETYGGSGKNIYGDKYGKAAESEEKDHEILWSTFVLFRSKEWMRISGNPEAEEDYIPSALEYANPFTEGLPIDNTMMPEDFR